MGPDTGQLLLRALRRISSGAGLRRSAASLAAAIGLLSLTAAPAIAGRIEPGKTKTLAFTGINTLLLGGVGLALIGLGMIAWWIAHHGRAVRRHG